MKLILPLVLILLNPNTISFSLEHVESLRSSPGCLSNMGFGFASFVAAPSPRHLPHVLIQHPPNFGLEITGITLFLPPGMSVIL